eukprot:240268_1
MTMQTKLRLFVLGLRRYKLTFLACSCGIGITGFKAWSNRSCESIHNSANNIYWRKESEKEIPIELIPTRREQLAELQRHSKSSCANYKYSVDGKDKKDEYDVIVIGGGATGSGIALDAATRGLSVALVECNDWSAGASSRSTKLIHGGIRYLEQAITKFDSKSWDLIYKSILERRHLINITPYVTGTMPIIVPVYDEGTIPFRGWLQLIKHYIGLKIYEGIGGKDGLLAPTFYLSSAHIATICPHLKQQNMTGAIVYYDGTHNDARMGLGLALTAAYYGANVANYCEMVDFIKANEQIIGVRLRDTLTGNEWNSFAKVVINATGCGVDLLRRKDNCKLSKNDNLIIPSRGTHLMLPGTFSSKNYGMLNPKTNDDRVAFLLPFEGATIAGTTDVGINHEEIPNAKNIHLIQPSQEDVTQILTEINAYLDIPVNVSDIDAVWSGLRPLACTPNGYYEKVINGTNNVNVIERNAEAESTETDGIRDQPDTKHIPREHLIEVAPSGLITVCGGKWTTYRKMAQDCLDVVCELKPEIGRRATECVTKIVKIIGSANWTHCVPAILERHNIPSHIAHHLSTAYGDKSFIVGNLYLSKWDKLLAGGYNYTEAEVIYCSKYEMSQTPIDILSRRTRLAQLNKAAAEYALPKVIQLMGSVHDWNVRDRVMHYHDTMEFLRTMHVKDRHKWGRSRHTLDYSRRVVETVLDGPSMTDEAIQFVIDRFWDYHSQNDDIDGNENENEMQHEDDDLHQNEDEDELMQRGDSDRKQFEKTLKKHKQSRQLFEGCISRAQCLELAKEFSEIFGDDRVIDALMFTGQKQLGLYEILVSCAACASHRELFEPNCYYYY